MTVEKKCGSAPWATLCPVTETEEYVPEKKPKKLIGDYLTAINKTKDNIMRESEYDPQTVSAYPAFFVRRILSYHEDAVLIANEINLVQEFGLDNRLQFEYLLHGLSKKNRYAKLVKEEEPENLDLIKRYYNISSAKAHEILALHTQADIADIKAAMFEGGSTCKVRSAK